MNTVDGWVRGFARQADADFRAWELYQRHSQAVAATCHQMLFLQMACEKLCKAYILKNQIQSPEDVQSSHGYVKKHLPTILKQEIAYLKSDKLAQMRHLMKQFSHLAKEIEVLNPSMDRQARPDNCEYPWDAGGEILSPLDWNFQPLQLLSIAGGPTFLKLLRLAINRIL